MTPRPPRRALRAKLTMRETSRIHTEFLLSCERVAGRRLTAYINTPEYNAARDAVVKFLLPIVKDERRVRRQEGMK